MKKKRVLICGIRDYGNRSENQYFMSDDYGNLKFCDGLVYGEGEVKKILSSVEIDEIIAIGTSNQCLVAKDVKRLSVPYKKMRLNEGIELFISDTDGFSDFDFLRYRLTQFVEGIDIDTADLIGKVDNNRQIEIAHQLKSLFGEDLSKAFFIFATNEEIRSQVMEMAKTLPNEEVNWTKRYLYSVLDKKFKISAKTDNSAIPISFVPITDEKNRKALNRFNNLIEELLTETDTETEIELYVDLHGFFLEDSFVCMNALYALHEDPNSVIRIKDIIDESIALSGYLYEIRMSSDRYKVQKLMAGIKSFIQNGKTDILREYWSESKKHNQDKKNEYIDSLFLAMSYVDAGISLCAVDELEKGIYGLRKLFNSNETLPESDDEGEALILTLKDGIIKDYGSLITNSDDEIDSFELIKWAYRKKFYQQVITIIESRMPKEMVERGILYPASNEEEKLAYLKAINFHYWDCLQKDRYIFRDLEHYFIKTYGRFGVNYRDRSMDKTAEYTRLRVEQVFGGSDDNGLLPAKSIIKDKELLTMIMDKYYRLCNVRNTINHALGEKTDKEDTPKCESKIWNEVGTMIGEFIDCYQKVLDNIDEKEFNQLKITQEEFKNYIYNHGPKSDPDFRNVTGYISNKDRIKR
ncbi:MAG: hypothetical protein PUE18_03215 [Firmicutes bacterium]|nr:hypothetical protein [Bacillota bacterium]